MCLLFISFDSLPIPQERGTVPIFAHLHIPNI